MNNLLWWRDATPPATLLDPVAEASRLKAAKEKGDPLNQGATPVIEREKSSWIGM